MVISYPSYRHTTALKGNVLNKVTPAKNKNKQTKQKDNTRMSPGLINGILQYQANGYVSSLR